LAIKNVQVINGLGITRVFETTFSIIEHPVSSLHLKRAAYTKQ
jgi:hypothetical protein